MGWIGQRERAGGSATLGLRDSPSSFSSGCSCQGLLVSLHPAYPAQHTFELTGERGPGEMAQGSRGLAAFSEDTCLIPSTNTCGSSQPRATTVPGESDTCFWPVWAAACTWCTDIETKHLSNINEKGERKDCELNRSKAVSEALTK